MRLLVVDDEVEVLRGLRRLLFAYDESWQVEFATSGATGLELMAKAPFDVVVSDVRMPGMDGVAFLGQVRVRHPQTIRFVLSGGVDERTAVRSLDVAHQFLLKPFEAQLFCNLVQQTNNLLSGLQDSSVRQHIGSLSQLPAAPRLYSELSSALQRDETTTSEVVRLIGHDPTMAAKLLQLANSGFFARRIATADLDTAVLHLGMNTIRQLVLTVELFDVSGIVGRHVLTERETLRKKALRMATFAEQLACGTVAHTEAFTMGLLADIGKLLIWLAKGEAWLKCRRHSQKTGTPLHELEAAEFGVTHAEIGGYLLGVWGLPFSVVEAVAYHHRPLACGVGGVSASSIVSIAAALAEGTRLDDDWLADIGMSERVRALRGHSSMRSAG